MKKWKAILVLGFCAFFLQGCNNASHKDVGVIAGGVAGGLLGSSLGEGSGKLFGTIAGTIAGAYIGGSIGEHMDREDRIRMQMALEDNAVGQPSYWRNAHSGTTYKVVPIKNVSVGANRYCREYRSIANIDGKKQHIYGTACRQADGSWKTI